MKASRECRRTLRILSKVAEGIRLSRKEKLVQVGRLMSRKDLRRLLDSVVIKPCPDWRDGSEILPFAFCPQCGCQAARSTGNLDEYPFLLVRGYCERCRLKVFEADNSPYVHILEIMDLKTKEIPKW